MTKTPDIEARVELLEARVETLSRRLTTLLGETPDALNPADTLLFEALKEWRRWKAVELALPTYVVFPDKALAAIASTRPTDKYALSQLKGISDKRVNEYGDDVIDIVRGASDW